MKEPLDIDDIEEIEMIEDITMHKNDDHHTVKAAVAL